HEGYHHLHVVEAHLIAHALERTAFELEAGSEGLVDVTRSAAKAEHRVFLVRLVVLAADQVRILVRFEIRKTYDDRLGRKRRGDLRDAFRQLVDIKADRIRIARNLLSDRLLELRTLLVEFQQGARMHADHAIDDEFEPRQTYALVRYAGEIERAVGIADVHHDFNGKLGQGIQFYVALIVFQHAVVDMTGVPFRAGDCHRLIFANHAGGVDAADHRRNTELARNDGRMAGPAASIGDDGCGPLHHGLPIRIGHVGNQHIARPHAGHLLHVSDDARMSGPDALPDAAPAHEQGGAGLEREALDRPPGAALHRFGPRLQDVEHAGVAVLAPFDIHRRAVVLLDDQRLLC